MLCKQQLSKYQYNNLYLTHYIHLTALFLIPIEETLGRRLQTTDDCSNQVHLPLSVTLTNPSAALFLV